MQGQIVTLRKAWTVGGMLGQGGYGRVFEVTSGDDQALAKFVRKQPGAEREMLFAETENARNVIPIIDSGETDDDWVLVMPRAEKSLRQHIEAAGGPIAPTEAVQILADIATALSGLKDRVTHRDLKPENVLLYDGHWCLADFGIARYADAATATHTFKHIKSQRYAAPEQWRHQRATSATDVYALGVIGFELVQGQRPFLGPAEDDLRQQHTEETPPAVSNAPAPLAALIAECLYKPAQARPEPDAILKRLQSAIGPPVPDAIRQLQEANWAEVERRTEEGRRASEEKTEAERRGELYEAARANFQAISTTLRETIVAAASASDVHHGGLGAWRIELGGTLLSVSSVLPVQGHSLGDWITPGIDVIAKTSISLEVPTDSYGYEGRSHSFWYCDAERPGQYAWFEIAFMIHPLVNARSSKNPFSLDPGESAAKALSPVMAEHQVARKFKRLVVGDLDEFVHRWVEWFAFASAGRLRHPHSLPED